MATERIFPGRKDGDGWIFQEKIICDQCKTVIGERQEYSSTDTSFDKYRHGEYPGYRCIGCKAKADRAYDDWATSSSRMIGGVPTDGSYDDEDWFFSPNDD